MGAEHKRFHGSDILKKLTRPVVVLTPHERWEAVMQLGIRINEIIHAGRRDAFGADQENGWSYHLEGIWGEKALAKYLNIYWQGSGAFRGADVGTYQVRTTANENWGLVLNPNDKPEDIFWAMLGSMGTYRVIGWIKAVDGKVDQNVTTWTRENETARQGWIVPWDELNPPEIRCRWQWSPEKNKYVSSCGHGMAQPPENLWDSKIMYCCFCGKKI
jgi:hypothetical protein